MNQSTIKAENRKRVLACLRKARANPSGGLKATVVAKRTKLCLRTVQAHLRDLREKGEVINEGGVWAATSYQVKQ